MCFFPICLREDLDFCWREKLPGPAQNTPKLCLQLELGWGGGAGADGGRGWTCSLGLNWPGERVPSDSPGLSGGPAS